MSRTILLLATITFSPTVWGGIVVEIVPSQVGPYLGGESFEVDFWLHSNEPFASFIKGVRFDFIDSDPGLTLGDEFEFDYSAVPNSTGQTIWQTMTWPALPRPRAHMTLDCLCKPYYMILPAAESIRIGMLEVQLPVEAGTYRLDAMNVDEPDIFAGGAYLIPALTSGNWTAFGGNLTGGTYDFHVIPEPSVAVLLSIGFAVANRKTLLCANIWHQSRCKVPT